MAVLKDFVSVNKTQQNLKAFDCGKATMNTFIARFASRDMGLGISSTWVLPTDDLGPDKKSFVAAYFTLCSSTVTREEIPQNKLPPYPVPVTLLAKLAVDQRYQGQRIGEKTLVYALREAVSLADRGLPAVGVTLDVLDEDALSFYQKFDFFEPFTDDPMRLFVPMNLLRDL